MVSGAQLCLIIPLPLNCLHAVWIGTPLCPEWNFSQSEHLKERRMICWAQKACETSEILATNWYSLCNYDWNSANFTPAGL